MRKEFGKWLLDISKYITTAVILSSVFGEVDTWQMYLVSIISVIATLGMGLYLTGHKNNKNVNTNNQQNGSNNNV